MAKETNTLPISLNSVQVLRLRQNFGNELVKKQQLSIYNCRNPGKHWFVWTHTDDEYFLDSMVVEIYEA